MRFFRRKERGSQILPTIYHETSTASSETDEDNLKQTGRCCGIKVRSFAVFVASLEIIVSFLCILYSIAGLYSFPDYKAGIIFQDDMFLEAKKQYCGSKARIPIALLFCDLFIFTVELIFALVLFHGVIEKKMGKIHCWLSSMVIYTVTLTGIFLGFVVGGVTSYNLALTGILHAAFRFFEISLIYAYYEHLKAKREDERRFIDNNNSGNVFVESRPLSREVPHSHAINPYEYDLARAGLDLQFPFP